MLYSIEIKCYPIKLFAVSICAKWQLDDGIPGSIFADKVGNIMNSKNSIKTIQLK